jgi:ABC-type sugar transport system permease subunit
MKKKRMTLRQKRAITGLLFISPWIIGFLLYYVRSIIVTAQFSFNHIEMAETGGLTKTFVGWDNYVYAFTQFSSYSRTFNQIVFDSFMNILTDVPFITFFSLFIAMLLNNKFKGRTLVRAIFFIPILLGTGAIASSLQNAITSIQGGAAVAISEMAPPNGINVDYYIGVFMDLGIPQNLMNYIIGLLDRIFTIVRSSSVQIIIFIAALQSVSASLYEVSKIEGATSYETFWKVTFPMVSPLILTNVVYTIIDSFSNSELVQLAYTQAFPGFEFGFSAAISIVATLLVSLVLIVVGTVITRYTFYHN